MSKFGKINLMDEDLPEGLKETAVVEDLTELLAPKANGTRKEMRCTYVMYGKEKLYKAKDNKGNLKWTNSTNSPQIVNEVTGRQRGSIAFANGDVGKKGGRPKGSSNRVSAKQVCDSLGIHPAEYAAAILTSDPVLCRKYGIKNVNEITIKNKEACMKELYVRLEGAAKARQLDSEGNEVGAGNNNDDEKQGVLLYMPEKGAEIEIRTSDTERAEMDRLVGERGANLEWTSEDSDE